MKCEQCLSPGECNGETCLSQIIPTSEQPLVYRLRKRAQIRRQSPDRLAIKENKADRLADLLEEAANEIEQLRLLLKNKEK